jgi:hypothetical protein
LRELDTGFLKRSLNRGDFLVGWSMSAGLQLADCFVTDGCP